ncbi:MAG: hypothetical protein MUP86_02165 [Dehalococcoidia bacterium]|nr:hypothetical protein [Dehalococcoidia bacterium]
MTTLWVILSIVLWLLIGIAFARRFRVALAELADVTRVGTGWLLIIAWPVYALVLLWMEAMIRAVDFGELGDRLANVARAEAETAQTLEKTIIAMDRLAQAATSFGETVKTKEKEVPHGEW